MEKLKRIVNEIAYAQEHAKLTPIQSSLIPLLSLASSLYGISLFLRHSFYRFGFFSKHRLPVPVISVGNLTWGGNGKTPMVEFLAHCLADSEISPLILTRGYAGGDEVRMLERHLLERPAKIGVGANRAATAASFIEKYGYVDPRDCASSQKNCINPKVGSHLKSGKIGAVILDDGMQHWSLRRDLEIVMVNGLMPWGNRKLVPLGPLREPLMALKRADIAVVHHADLISEQNLKDVELEMRDIKKSLSIFFTRMAPSYLFEVGNINSKIPLTAVCNANVLCVSAIGSANAFVQSLQKLGSCSVNRLDFNDHHSFQARDYDRDPEILMHLEAYKALVLCSKLQIIPCRGCTEDSFKLLLKELLDVK